MPSTYRGTTLPKRQRLTEHWSPTNGYFADAEYRGFNETQVRALATQWQANGLEFELTNQHGVYTLRGTDTSGSTTIDTWEIGLNKMSPHITECPVALAALATGTGYTSAHLDALKDFAKGDKTRAEATTALGSNAPGLRILDRMSKGGDAYMRAGYVLRHTTNVMNRYAVNVADIYVDHVYTTAQLLSEATNGALWTFPLPGRLAYKVQTIASDYLTYYGEPAYHTLGWLKSGSPETSSANTRVNIVTEYEFAAWSEDVYLLV